MLAVVAIAEQGGLLNAPDVYMDKIAIGPGYPQGIIDLDATPTENLQALAKAKGVPISAITACILDRPRHARLIDEVRHAGASIRLIGDGDIAGVIQTTLTYLYLGAYRPCEPSPIKIYEKSALSDALSHGRLFKPAVHA